ncbi:hypothetical protein L2D08_20295 [Domibacillus sp. PGB-M46]|uniref:hypothetical protein n=1 Tax=Domibacillus sp. PGB-M46 TaxID=2910255 RepID=UPI001F59C386|nr:hypothetical protein [Domibacillus sp. PGB-M46]MCI2256676.1 hypothetical protein [Domibacillus sp. PGB-M46]
MFKIILRNYLIVTLVYSVVMLFFFEADKVDYISGWSAYTLGYLIVAYREIKKEKKTEKK